MHQMSTQPSNVYHIQDADSGSLISPKRGQVKAMSSLHSNLKSLPSRLHSSGVEKSYNTRANSHILWHGRETEGFKRIAG